MFVAVYFHSRTGMARDELEGLILDSLQEDGVDHGKVTGGGSGIGGSNVDLEVDDTLTIDEVLRRIRNGLQRVESVSRDTKIQIEGKLFPLYPM